MQANDQVRDPIQTYFFGNDAQCLTEKTNRFAQPVVVQEKTKPEPPTRGRRKKTPTPDTAVPEYKVDVAIQDENGNAIQSHDIDPNAAVPKPVRPDIPVAPLTKSRRGKSLYEFMEGVT